MKCKPNKYFIALVLLIVLYYVTFTQAQQGNDQSFNLHQNALSWDAANTNCSQESSSLAIAPSANSMNVLSSLIRSSSISKLYFYLYDKQLIDFFAVDVSHYHFCDHVISLNFI